MPESRTKYADVAPSNPVLGDLAHVDGRCSVWAACSICGTPRWVRTVRGGVPLHDRCSLCKTSEERIAASLRETGKKHSPERVEANRIAHLGQTVSQEVRDKISRSSKGRKHTAEAISKLSAAHKKLWSDPFFAERQRCMLQEASNTPQAREKRRVGATAAAARRWNQYIPIRLTRPTVQYLYTCDAGEVGDILRTRSGRVQKIRCADCQCPLYVRLEQNTPRNVRCHACASRKMIQDYPQIFGEARMQKWIQSMSVSLHVKPNKAEMKLLAILNDLFPNQWEYTGNWKLVINGKNPDFANINGKKQLIELFEDYWHQGQNPDDRIGVFAKFGYATLVIWERELKDVVAVSSRLREFAVASAEAY